MNEHLAILPDLKMDGSVLVCNHQHIELHRRPLTLRLLKAMMDAPEQTLNRHQLVEAVYEILQPNHRSQRFYETACQNLTKLVSRARLYLEAELNKGGEPWIEILVYLSEKDAWTLFRLKNEYIGRFADKKFKRAV